jgi:hypothetical protein
MGEAEWSWLDPGDGIGLLLTIGCRCAEPQESGRSACRLCRSFSLVASNPGRAR